MHTYELTWDDDADYICLVKWGETDADGIRHGTECTRWLIPGTEQED